MKFTLSVFIVLLALGCAEEEVSDPYHEIDGEWSVVYYIKSPMKGEIIQYDRGEVVFHISSRSALVSIEDHVEIDGVEEGQHNISFGDGPCDHEGFKSIFFDSKRLGTLSVYSRDSMVVSEGCIDGSTMTLVR